jgi:type VI secretion system secreted protein Hcp
MPSDYYLKIEGVKGESKAEGMSEYIELESFSFGASNPADVKGGGLAAGRASLSDFSFTCSLDAASPFILKDLYTGKHIDSCTFVGRKTGGSAKPEKYLEVTMTSCFITAHSVGGGAQGIPSQSVSLAYEQIKYEYFAQNTKTGGMTSAGVATYDVAKVQQS